MVLAHYGDVRSEADLRSVLDTQPTGTRAGNLMRLSGPTFEVYVRPSNLAELEDPAQSDALADDLPEFVLGADLLLQVGLLLGELVLECLNLLEGQSVLDGHGHLIGNELQETYVRRLVGGRLLVRENQRAQPAPSGDQRKRGTAPPGVRSRLLAVSRLT
jgi:hypothetical protein